MTVTLGEAFARRRLRQETVNNGLTYRYVPGQYGASKLGADEAIVSWVDREGGICIVPCECVNGEWFQKGWMLRASLEQADARPLARTFALTDDMVRAVQAAMVRPVTKVAKITKVKQAPPAGSGETDGEQPQGQESGDPASGGSSAPEDVVT